MFIDQVKVYIKAGDGGDGLVTYRREKYVPMGGPAGGDGGNGGDIVFKVDEGLSTLLDLHYSRHYKAKPGENGMRKKKHGQNSPKRIVSVPPGTTVTDIHTGEVIADLTTHKQEAVIAKGGRGGRGNARFASSRNPAPDIAEKGEPGQERDIQVELKMIADVGLVGFPSVGKSTLLSVISAAKPKIADYHFTTLAPNLGVVQTSDDRSFVMADMPGLIEGAHEGVGLGQQFLRHAERTRVIVHVIDMAATEGRDPYEDFLKINHELSQYDSMLKERPQIIAANKMDMPDADKHLQQFQDRLEEDYPIYQISAVTHSGLRNLLLAVANKLEETPKTDSASEDVQTEEAVVYKHRSQSDEFNITRDSDGAYVLSGEKVEKLFKMTDLAREESAQRFSRQLRAMGIDSALRKRGAKDGDTIRLLDYEFEFIE